MGKKQRVAIFDIDGTIFRSSLLVELVEALVARGVFSKNTKREYQKSFAAWLDRKKPYDEYIGDVVAAFQKQLKGVQYSTFQRVARDVVLFHKNRVYRYTRDLASTLKKKNYFLLAISNSPKIVVEAFAKNMGFDKIYGRMYAVDEQKRFTGETLHRELVDDKSEIVLRAVAKCGLTLRGSIGVGDTDSDISFLSLVEKPICFNPNQKLFSYARRAHWNVVVERKDVIYDHISAPQD